MTIIIMVMRYLEGTMAVLETHREGEREHQRSDSTSTKPSCIHYNSLKGFNLGMVDV